MGIEYELKFQATEKAQSAILKAFCGIPCLEYEMETTYYDTPSGALSARHYTLRRRMENDLSVCTLKTPAGNLGRNEIEISCADIQAAIPRMTDAPADFQELVAEGLIAVCGAKFHRIAMNLQYQDCRLELALDSGVLTGGGKEIPLCEVEVELKSGSTESADIFALELATRYGLLPETKSKFRRALSLYKGEIV